MKPRHLRIAVIAASLAAAPFALAAGDAADKNTMDKSRPASDAASYSDRARMKEWSGQKDQLEQALRTGESKDFYRQEIERLGYKITAINQNKPDYLEYEIVKGANTYEVQVDFDKDSAKANKVDVTANVWKADSTERALKDPNYAAAYPETVTEGYSDRSRMKTWRSEKDRLENALKTGQPRQYYPAELKRLGYQVTAVNDDEKDYAEYEIVKGRDSFEVQIDFDNVGKATKVDVTTNMWEADATDRAKDKGSRK